MAFCLTIEEKTKFKRALKNREIDPAVLEKWDSLKRREYLAKYVGNNASKVNALFESKLLLKNKKAGWISWAKKTGGISSGAKKDMISMIQKLDKVFNPAEEEMFLQDLAAQKLKVGVTQQEAKVIFDLSSKITNLNEKANKEGVFSNENDRLEYGDTQYQIEEYINNIKREAKGFNTVDVVKESPGVLKSLQSTLDNSFFGRQGIKVLYNNPLVWIKNFAKSWVDIGRELRGKDAMRLTKADIYSRPNAVNGKYKAGGYGLDVLSEEAYPSSLPSRIPLLGRLFKASESAYNGAALRMRADLADKFIKLAEKNGINTLDPKEARPIGNLIGSLTGRGNWGKLEGATKEANVLFYSVKLLKANIDTLLAPSKYAVKKLTGRYGTIGEEFAGKEAAKSSLRIIGTIGAILATAKVIDPDSVDFDPTSTNFGKIKVFGQWTDITGGMGAIVRLAARIALGRSKSTTGKVTEYKTGFGATTALDEIETFFEGKLSPVAGLLRDKLKGEMFGGEKFTWSGALKNAVLPLSIQNAYQILKDPKSEFPLGSIILEGLGLSTSAYNYKTDWSNNPNKTLQQFKEKVGEDKFKQANEEYNQAYNQWLNNVSQMDGYKSLSNEYKDKLNTAAKEKLQSDIFKKYNFKYKQAVKTQEQKKEEKTIKSLQPK